jgi:hypothetical protein
MNFFIYNLSIRLKLANLILKLMHQKSYYKNVRFFKIQLRILYPISTICRGLLFE